MQPGILPKILALIFSLLIVTSCSKTRFIYSYFDWFLLKRFDAYFDLKIRNGQHWKRESPSF